MGMDPGAVERRYHGVAHRRLAKDVRQRVTARTIAGLRVGGGSRWSRPRSNVASVAQLSWRMLQAAGTDGYLNANKPAQPNVLVTLRPPATARIMGTVTVRPNARPPARRYRLRVHEELREPARIIVETPSSGISREEAPHSPRTRSIRLGRCARAGTRSPRPRALAREAAATVTITRDDWGIAHIHGKTEADAVFGMVYAQAEDDFNRVETNYHQRDGPARRGGGRDARYSAICA